MESQKRRPTDEGDEGRKVKHPKTGDSEESSDSADFDIVENPKRNIEEEKIKEDLNSQHMNPITKALYDALAHPAVKNRLEEMIISSFQDVFTAEFKKLFDAMQSLRNDLELTGCRCANSRPPSVPPPNVTSPASSNSSNDRVEE